MVIPFLDFRIIAYTKITVLCCSRSATTRHIGGIASMAAEIKHAIHRSSAVTRLISTAIVVAGLILSAPSLAEFRNGSALLQYCTATIGAEMAFCFGYIDGIADLLLEHHEVEGFSACITTQPDDSQLRNVVTAFLRKNEGIHHLAAPGLVARALSEAFPCR
jgi:hypothetical protein